MHRIARRTVQAVASLGLAAFVALADDPPELIFREPVLIDFLALPERDAYVNAAVGDVNGDGRADVVLAGMSDAVRYLAGTPDGSVAATATTVTDDYRGGNAGLSLLEAVDMDGDGDDDIALDARFKAVVLLRNDGGGVFTEIAADAGEEILSGARILFDLGDDGDLDVLASVYRLPYKTDPGYLVFENLGGSFAPGQRFPFAVSGIIRPCDFNGDGLDDVVVAGPDQAVVLRQTPAGALVADPPVSYPTSPQQGAAVIDVDGDGDQDLLALGRVLRNDGTGALVADPAPILNRMILLPVVVDFDNDGLQDIVDIGGGVKVELLRNTGGAFAPPFALPHGVAAGSLKRFAVEDADEDGKADLVALPSVLVMSILRQAGAPAPTGLEVTPEALQDPGPATVSLTGAGFLDGATVDFGPGIAVTGVAVPSGTEATALLAVDPGIGGGTRTVRFTNPDRQVVQSTIEVRSLDAEAVSGRLLDSPAPARDVLRVKGLLPRNGLSAHAAFAGLEEGLRLEIGSGPTRLVVEAPAQDPRWRVKAGGRRLVFESLPDEFPRIRISVDARRERFDLAVSFFDYPQAPADASLGVLSGDDLGRDAATWEPRRGDRYRLR